MSIDSSNPSCSGVPTSVVLQTLPQIDEEDPKSNKPPKERLLEFLDILEGHVEQLRKNASQLEEDKDALLVALDSVINADILYNLQDCDRDEVNRYTERIINRCLTVEVKVLTQRDKMQEDALYQVNHFIDGLVMVMKTDPESAQARCISFMNACSSSLVHGVTDKNFESALLGCSLDDQKKVKRRLQGLLNYFEKMNVVPYHN
ncbi:unnamed protein product [Phyllotreta striolata]|uniref:BAG family molecular chaperone regulator 2 n=1 Tax=Phyllotreta striolata TaxID=444603 RepID=A0A9N9TQD3_PHYSR|nr:unnamed protein product [Phyllotreta striolata]